MRKPQREPSRRNISPHIHALRISTSEFTFAFVTVIISHVRPIIGAFLSAVTCHPVGWRPILLKRRNKEKRDPPSTHEHIRAHTEEGKNRELHVERPQRPTVDKWLKLFLSTGRGTTPFFSSDQPSLMALLIPRTSLFSHKWALRCERAGLIVFAAAASVASGINCSLSRRGHCSPHMSQHFS